MKKDRKVSTTFSKRDVEEIEDDELLSGDDHINDDGELELPLTFKSLKLTLVKKDQSKVKAIIVELDGVDRGRYLDLVVGRAKLVNGQATGITKVSGLNEALLGMCLFHRNEEDQPTVPFSLQEMKDFPSGTLEVLYQKAMKISRLGATKKEEDAEKN